MNFGLNLCYSGYIHVLVHQYIYIARVPPPFGTNMQLQNEFHLQMNSNFVDRTENVTINHGERGRSGYIHVLVHQYMNIARVAPPFGTNMQLQNEFHLKMNSNFVDRTENVTINHGERGRS